MRVAVRCVGNERGASSVDQLFRLLADCRPGDVLLVEQADRLSRLTVPDWIKLRAKIDAKQVGIVALDLSTSSSLAAPADDAEKRLVSAECAWIAFRDEDRNLQSTSALGGMEEPVVFGDCQSAMTKARVETLEADRSAS